MFNRKSSFIFYQQITNEEQQKKKRKEADLLNNYQNLNKNNCDNKWNLISVMNKQKRGTKKKKQK